MYTVATDSTFTKLLKIQQPSTAMYCVHNEKHEDTRLCIGYMFRYTLCILYIISSHVIIMVVNPTLRCTNDVMVYFQKLYE